MLEILIPAALRSFTDGNSSVETDASTSNTVAKALEKLAEEYPEIKKQLFESDGSVRGFINVFVGDTNVNDLNGADTPVKNGDTIMLVPAIAGGNHKDTNNGNN
jgi:adenylyltransferase/sulfurtransferase